MAPEASTTRIMTPNFMKIGPDTVTLKIGQAEIAIHRDLLTTTSDYFRKAFDEPGRDANERSITLEGVSERSLNMFLQWAYAQSLQFDTSSAALEFDTLLPSAVAEDIKREANTSAEVVDAVKKAESKPTAKADGETGSSLLFDEKRYHAVFTRWQLYQNKEAWRENADEFYVGLTELYILAHKYSMPQLRDDVVTAFVGQCWKWYWFPAEDDKALILLMATDLPISSKLRKFLACSIVRVGIDQPDINPEQIMQSMRELDPDLTHKIGVTFAMEFHKADTREDHPRSTDLEEHIPNACKFHDHTHLDQDQCRNRIASRPHIFTAILDACAKAVMINPAEEE